MVATEYRLGLHNLLASVAHHGLSYTVLEFGCAWRGWRGRMASYRDAARAHAALHGPTALVVFVDAYDALSTRDARGLVAAFRQFGKPLLIGLEAGCLLLFTGNCGYLDEYWAATQGKLPDRPNVYGNGGFVMGEAHAVAGMYAWMLDKGFTDDQVGLAHFTNKHPLLVAADEASTVIENKYWAEGASGRTAAGTAPYFTHFPGVKDNPLWLRYAETVKETAGPFAIAVNDTTTASRVWTYWILGAAVLLALVAFSCGHVLGSGESRRRGGGGSTGATAAVQGSERPSRSSRHKGVQKA